MSNEKQLIQREIKAQAQQARIRGVIVSTPATQFFDSVGLTGFTFVCDVDVGGDELLRDVPVKINGPKARYYARIGSPVFLDRDAQGRYQVTAPADRAPAAGNLFELDEDAETFQQGAGTGFTVVREPYEFYKGVTPESFFDPALDAATLVWLRAYDRLTGLPDNIVVASDTDGADVLQIDDKSLNGFDAQQTGVAGENPVYRRFDATGGNTNLRSTVDSDGSNDKMDFALNISETTGGAVSFFILLNRDAVGGGDDVILQTADWRIFSRQLLAGDFWGYDQGGGVTNSGNTIGSSFTLIEIISTTFGAQTLYQDGTLIGPFTPAGAGLGLASSHLFNNDAGTAEHDGRLVELLIMDETVSSVKRQAIENYFNQTIFVQFARYNNGSDGFPKIRIFDANGVEQ